MNNKEELAYLMKNLSPMMSQHYANECLLPSDFLTLCYIWFRRAIFEKNPNTYGECSAR